MSYRELAEHAGYIGDSIKVAAYRAALNRAVSPGDVVIDLGAGSGLLGLLALEAGAARVIAVDFGAISAMTKEVFAANGFADQVEVRRINSKQLELDDPADLVVCDQIGGFAHEVGLTGVVRDLFDRGVVKPTAKVVPAFFDLLVMPVSAPPDGDPVHPWVSNTTGMSFAPFAASAQNTLFRLVASADWAMGDGVLAAQLDPADTSAISFEVDCEILTGGSLTGILGYMRAHLDMRDGVVLTNGPADPGRFNRWQVYHPVAEPIPVAAGDVVSVKFDIHQVGGITNWSVRTGEQARSGSTFLGEFMDPNSLFAAQGTLPALNPAGSCRLAALEGIRAGRGFEEIATEMRAEFPGMFGSPSQARKMLRDLVGSYCEPR